MQKILFHFLGVIEGMPNLFQKLFGHIWCANVELLNIAIIKLDLRRCCEIHKLSRLGVAINFSINSSTTEFFIRKDFGCPAYLQRLMTKTFSAHYRVRSFGPTSLQPCQNQSFGYVFDTEPSPLCALEQ